MQSARHLAPLTALHDVERLIEDRLTGDWIVRVEHADDVNPVNTQWQQWGEALFAIKDAKAVVEKILVCRASHPHHSIRLCAERSYPRIRFIYGVCRPQEDDLVAVQAEAALNRNSANNNAWLASGDEAVKVARRGIWPR